MRLLLSFDSEHEPEFTSTTTCNNNSQNCSNWKQTYSHSNDFAANVSIVLIILFSSLVCVLSLHVAFRCFLRPVRKLDPDTDSAATTTTTLVYSPGLNLAGTEAECIICLSEFQDGDTLRVLDKCNHGFHIHCIQQWLSSNSSCPTCRTNIFSSPITTP